MKFFKLVIFLLNKIQGFLKYFFRLNIFLKVVSGNLYTLVNIIRDLKRIILRAKNITPTILTGWDNTPRYGRRGFTITPVSIPFLLLLELRLKKKIAHNGAKIIFIKAWNEWAEGNYIEIGSSNAEYRKLFEQHW